MCLVLILLILLSFLWLGIKAQHDLITLGRVNDFILWTMSKDGCLLHGDYCLFFKESWNLVSL